MAKDIATIEMMDLELVRIFFSTVIDQSAKYSELLAVTIHEGHTTADSSRQQAAGSRQQAAVWDVGEFSFEL